MKLFVGLLTLILALIISAVAAYFSVAGLAALFAATFWPVVIMGSALEAGKLVAASWLKFNWRNPRVGIFHKIYLTLAVGVLMIVTALGIYGFLAKGHLEQEAPLAGVELQVARIEQRVSQTREERDRLEVKLKQLDQSINTILNNSKTTRDAQAALRARQQQQKEREQIQRDIIAKDDENNKLTDQLVPLRTKVNDVGAKLGPVKYVAKLFGWSDATTAVQLIILLIMFAFDPLAVVLILSGTITMSEWFIARRQRQVSSSVTPEITVIEATEPPTDIDLINELMTDVVIIGQSSFNEDSDHSNISATSSKSDKENLIEILERNPQLLSMLAEAAEAKPVSEEPALVREAEIEKPAEAEITSVIEPSTAPSVGFPAWAREIIRGGSK